MWVKQNFLNPLWYGGINEFNQVQLESPAGVSVGGVFLVEAIGNTFVSEQVAAGYARRGYPSWFHYLTAALELTTAILLAVGSMRFWGAALGAAVMGAAVATVLLHGEFTHAIAPLVVLTVALTVGWQNRPRK